MARSPRAQSVACCGNRGGVERRNCRHKPTLRMDSPFEAGAGVARAGNGIVALKGIVGKAQLESPGEAKFHQAVDILVRVAAFKAVLDFEYAPLDGFRGGSEGGTIGHGGDLIGRGRRRLGTRGSVRRRLLRQKGDCGQQHKQNDGQNAMSAHINLRKDRRYTTLKWRSAQPLRDGGGSA